ncbi:MAG TPA: zinc-dependent metalloprotease, partial [Acidobacteriota bacterium]|nr:zinc-dependent metalloprotease [Acidobacteriota bacterium]
VYLLHRYQVEAVVKLLGGMDYTYAVRGDRQIPITFISPQRQRDAVKAVLATIEADFLLIPERILNLIPPHPSRFPRTRESFPIRTGLTFDPLAAAEEAANWSISLLLEPSRAARLVEYQARNEQAQPQVRAIATLKLSQLKQWLLSRSKSITDQQQLAHFRYAANQIERFERDPKQVTLSKPLDMPPGPPIGMDCLNP